MEDFVSKIHRKSSASRLTPEADQNFSKVKPVRLRRKTFCLGEFKGEKQEKLVIFPAFLPHPSFAAVEDGGRYVF
ncbi:MAG: hypothetical protein AAF849_23420 [Bacteroidota bacterium]